MTALCKMQTEPVRALVADQEASAPEQEAAAALARGDYDEFLALPHVGGPRLFLLMARGALAPPPHLPTLLRLFRLWPHFSLRCGHGHAAPPIYFGFGVASLCAVCGDRGLYVQAGAAVHAVSPEEAAHLANFTRLAVGALAAVQQDLIQTTRHLAGAKCLPGLEGRRRRAREHQRARQALTQVRHMLARHRRGRFFLKQGPPWRRACYQGGSAELGQARARAEKAPPSKAGPYPRPRRRARSSAQGASRRHH
jgi:hypothetical protein